jgi:hypothetical protein
VVAYSKVFAARRTNKERLCGRSAKIIVNKFHCFVTAISKRSAAQQNKPQFQFLATTKKSLCEMLVVTNSKVCPRAIKNLKSLFDMFGDCKLPNCSFHRKFPKHPKITTVGAAN